MNNARAQSDEALEDVKRRLSDGGQARREANGAIVIEGGTLDMDGLFGQFTLCGTRLKSLTEHLLTAQGCLNGTFRRDDQGESFRGINGERFRQDAQGYEMNGFQIIGAGSAFSNIDFSSFSFGSRKPPMAKSSPFSSESRTSPMPKNSTLGNTDAIEFFKKMPNKDESYRYDTGSKAWIPLCQQGQDTMRIREPVVGLSLGNADRLLLVGESGVMYLTSDIRQSKDPIMKDVFDYATHSRTGKEKTTREVGENQTVTISKTCGKLSFEIDVSGNIQAGQNLRKSREDGRKDFAVIAPSLYTFFTTHPEAANDSGDVLFRKLSPLCHPDKCLQRRGEAEELFNVRKMEMENLFKGLSNVRDVLQKPEEFSKLMGLQTEAAKDIKTYHQWQGFSLIKIVSQRVVYEAVTAA